MRKKLTLMIDTEGNAYGVDQNNIAVLTPNEFRSTVFDSIKSGNFKDGDEFEIDIDKTGQPLKREFDQTVAVHKPVDKKYTRQDMIEFGNKIVNLVEEGKDIDIESLIP